MPVLSTLKLASALTREVYVLNRFLIAFLLSYSLKYQYREMAGLY